MKKIFALTCLMISLTSFAPENPFWKALTSLAVQVENGRKLQAQDSSAMREAVKQAGVKVFTVVQSWFATQSEVGKKS
jgi:hypothetical protein